jgi:hypothetical protein
MKSRLTCAAIKLRRALDAGEDPAGDGPIDPISGYSAPEIVRWLLGQGPDGERIAVRFGVRDYAEVNW